MGLGKPRRTRNRPSFERQKGFREKQQKLQNQYRQEILKLEAEIRRAEATLQTIDENRRKGIPTDPEARAEALRIKNTALARLGHVKVRIGPGY